MKARIEELKKMTGFELLYLAENITQQHIPNIIEVVSALMWEKAVKECDWHLLRMASILLMSNEDAHEKTIDWWLAWKATPTEKLICAIAALEAKEAKSNE